MNPFLLVVLLTAPAFPDDLATIRLDAPGECVTVAVEGKIVRLMIREALPSKTEMDRPEVVTADSSVRLSRRQAQAVADALDDAIRKMGGRLKEETASVPPDDDSDFDEYGQRKAHHRTRPPAEGEWVYVRKSDGREVYCQYRDKQFQTTVQSDILSWRRPDKSSSTSRESVFRLVSQCEGGQCRAPSVPRARIPARPAPAMAPVRSGFRRALRPLGRVLRCRGCR